MLGYTIDHGAKRFDATFFTHSLRNIAANDPGGGAYHAIIGTLEQVGIATLIAVPLGLLVSIYLVEYSRGRFGRLVCTFVDVMTGLPSIIAGLFVLTLWVLILKQGYSGFAGSLALVILMIPIVVRTTEEILRLVPDALREASYALGIPRWRTIVSIVLPSALPGITTGVMLAISRVSGETAPLLLTVFGNASINTNPFNGPQEGLPLFVFSEAGLPNNPSVDRAWAGALTLIVFVVGLNLIARLVIRTSVLRRNRPRVTTDIHHHYNTMGTDMAKRLDATNLNIYYGKFLAVSDVNLTIAPRSVTAFIGPSGCGKSTVLRTLNRMHEVIPGARVDGEVMLDGENIYANNVDPVDVRRTIGMVFQRPNPFPTMSIYDNVVAGLRLQSRRISKTDLDGVVEKSLRGANLWDEVKDRLPDPAPDCPVGSSSGCASPARSRSNPRYC